MSSLLKSRKFLLLVLDTVVSLVLLSLAQFAAPQATETVKQYILVIQPVFVAIIVAISVEDAAALKSGSHPAQSE